MEEIKDIVYGIIEKISRNRPQKQEEIQSAWERITTRHKIRNTKIKEIKDNSVIINVGAPAWLYQCRIKQGVILKEFQGVDKDIKKVFFRIGKTK